MQYLNFDKLESITRDQFWETRPFPYSNEQGMLTEEGFNTLLGNMPPLDLFYHNVGKERRAGQTPHDRYSLEYTAETPVPQPWQEFITELCSDRYRDNICRLLDVNKIEFRFHWHYTPTGCWVSPHTDSPREHGSHLFYFNSEQDWDRNWGGDTLVLDDGGKLDYNSAPDLDEFEAEIPCESIGNYSALMKRTDHAWHAVRPINCPQGEFLKIFILVVNPNSLFWKVRDRLIGKKKQAF